MPPRAFTTVTGRRRSWPNGWPTGRIARRSGARAGGHASAGLTGDPEEGKSAEGKSARKWRRLQEALQSECSATKKARYDRTAQRLRRLGKTTGLTRTDADILELLLRYQTQPIIESMVDDVFGRLTRRMNPLNLKGPALPALLRRNAQHQSTAASGTMRRLSARDSYPSTAMATSRSSAVCTGWPPFPARPAST